MTLYSKIKRILTLPCDEHQRLQSARMDGPLSPSERLAMWGHYVVCKPCRRLVAEMDRIDRVASERMANQPELSPAARSRLSQRLFGDASDGLITDDAGISKGNPEET
ncbi:MAG: hypothetical protein AAF539_05805 [Planctomycetota bacterium]